MAMKNGLNSPKIKRANDGVEFSFNVNDRRIKIPLSTRDSNEEKLTLDKKNEISDIKLFIAGISAYLSDRQKNTHNASVLEKFFNAVAQ